MNLPRHHCHSDIRDARCSALTSPSARDTHAMTNLMGKPLAMAGETFTYERLLKKLKRALDPTNVANAPQIYPVNDA